MDEPPDSPHLAKASTQLAHVALAICENRVELLRVEAQEERDRILKGFWLTVGMAVFGLLCGIALTGAVAVACWSWSPLATLLIISALYGCAAVILYLQLTRLRRDWESFPVTCDEFKKDCECLRKHLS